MLKSKRTNKLAETAPCGCSHALTLSVLLVTATSLLSLLVYGK